jgi:hypothetical protein
MDHWHFGYIAKLTQKKTYLNMATSELFTSEYGDFGQKCQNKTPFGVPSQILKNLLPSPEILPPEKEGSLLFLSLIKPVTVFRGVLWYNPNVAIDMCSLGWSS